MHNPCDPIVTVFSAVEELLKFTDIMGTLYTKLQAVNIAYIILYRTGKFGLVIHKRNFMLKIQNTWLQFKQFFLGISPRSERDVQSQRWRQRYASCQNGAWCCSKATVSLKTRTRPDGDSSSPAGACGPCGQRGAKHPAAVGHTAAENAVDHASYACAICCSAPWHTSILWRPPRIWRTWIPHEPIQLPGFEEDAAQKTTGIGVEAGVVKPTVILHITAGQTECVPIRVKTTGPQQMATKRTRYGVTRFCSAKETAPDRLGKYLLVKLM